MTTVAEPVAVTTISLRISGSTLVGELIADDEDSLTFVMRDTRPPDTQRKAGRQATPNAQRVRALSA